MAKPPSVVDVEKMAVEVDSPMDRSGKNDRLRTDELTVTVGSESEDTNTVVTNNTPVVWLLHHVSAAAETAISPGDVMIQCWIENEDGNAVVSQVGDAVSGSKMEFGGNAVRPGYTIEARVVNGTSSEVTVVVDPLIDRRERQEGLNLPRGAFEDWEGSDPLSRWTGDAGAFSVDTETANRHTQSLTCTDTSINAITLDGSTYETPEPDDRFGYSFRVDGTGGNDFLYPAIRFFEDSSSDDRYQLVPSATGQHLHLDRYEGGSRVDRWSVYVGSYEDGEWYTASVDTDTDNGSISVQLWDSEELAGTVTASDQLLTGTDFTVLSRIEDSGSQLWFDDFEFR